MCEENISKRGVVGRWRKLDNEELYSLYSSLGTLRE
jgi:hypothetical protein